MNIRTWFAVAACTVLIGLPQFDAQAARLGGGSNIGRTAPSMRPQATPAKPAQPQAAPQPQGAQPAKPAQPSATAAQPAKRSWLGPLAGLAAGLGLAALAAHFGLGEELMSLMLILLAVVAVFAIVRMLAARRQSQEGSYGQPAMARSGYGGNELGAEARPAGNEWPAQAMGGSSAPSATASQTNQEASSEEIESFIKVAREQFTKLQSIWDSGDIHALAEFCTPEMTRELSHQIAGRKGATNVTQVVRLDAEWLGISDSQDDFGKPVDEVQVRFSGLIRESADGAASDFDEVWTLHRAKNGQSGWLLAGITQVQ